MDKLIISYEQGYHNWYVSDFYKFFHKKLLSETNIELEYQSLSDLAKGFGKELNNQGSSIFNWFNLVIYNKKTEKFFVHSWYDYAPEILKYSVDNNFNVVRFSCVSNLSDSVIDQYKEIITVKPSVYYLENWADVHYIDENRNNTNKLTKAYFNGLNHGVRENILNCLSKNNFFDIRTKINPEHFRQKRDYYHDLSNYKFGLSLNGAANICYRDLELFGLGVINLRQPLISKTHNPIIKDTHYLEFIEDDLFYKILHNENVDTLIDEKIDLLMSFVSTNQYHDMIKESRKWFLDNCLPENQFKIILSFFDDFNIFF